MVAGVLVVLLVVLDLVFLVWLVGCWVCDGVDVGSGEQWSMFVGGMMFGIGCIVKGGCIVGFEFM